MIPSSDWLKSLFAAIDRMDADEFAAHLAGDVELQFGNIPVVKGREPVRAFVGNFFASIRAVRHDILEHWVCGETTIVCRGIVNYVRHDGSTMSAPFANVMKLEDGRATEYRVYADLSALFAS